MRQDQESNDMNVIRNNSAQRDDGISIIEMVLACCKSGGSKIPPKWLGQRGRDPKEDANELWKKRHKKD
jgi:hypothetical protein